MCRDDPTCYGLLQSVECYCSDEIGTPTKSFNFLHLGIQEYFAAKHVATLPEDEVYTLLEESFLVTDDDEDVDDLYEIQYADPDSKSVRLSNMWIMYCGITGGQSNSLIHYLSKSTLFRHSKVFERRWITATHHQATPKQPSRSTPEGDNLYNDNYFTPDISSPLSFSTPTDDDCNDSYHSDEDNVSLLPRVHNELLQLPIAYNSDHKLTISQDILKKPVKVLYLFQCFQEAQDDTLCDILSKSFDSDEINLHGNRLLPHQVRSLGFFISRSHRKWKELFLWMCYIGDHGINLLHHYLCGDETNKQEITTINDLTGASSPLIGDIITHLQPHTLKLGDNNITSVRDISLQ